MPGDGSLPMTKSRSEKNAAPFRGDEKQAMAHLAAYSSKSLLAKAMSYFLENFTELMLFVKNPILPIDNNPQERLLRNPVIGRKT